MIAPTTAYYLRGVGVGLLIAWVTGLIAYLRASRYSPRTVLLYLVILEAVLDAAFFIASIVIGARG